MFEPQSRRVRREEDLLGVSGSSCSNKTSVQENGAFLKRRTWPIWWDWELELSPHLLKRMADRRFTEVDLRHMLERATNFRRDLIEGRWIIETRHRLRRWEVIVEPDFDAELLVVVTAYPVWEL